jgi:hypothetical protein
MKERRIALLAARIALAAALLSAVADRFGLWDPPGSPHASPFCHPERTRISYFTALTSATYVVLHKENHMQLTEAATLDRKSGGSRGICSFTRLATTLKEIPSSPLRS